MSVVPKPSELFAAYYGVQVTGGAKTLPATGTGHLFTVAGGRVLVTSLTGVVTTAVQAQACTVSLGSTPTGGSVGIATLATANSVISAPVGQNLSMPALSAASAPQLLVVSSLAVAIPFNPGGIAVVGAGTIDWTTSATNTGAVTWSITYIPYDAGATVTAL